MAIIDQLENENIYADNMPEVIREFLRDDCISDSELQRFWLRAVKYIESYTGLSRERLEALPDVVGAMLALVADMHDNRQYQGERSYINELIDSILGMHRENLL